MSSRKDVMDFRNGMNNVSLPHMLLAGEAEEIQNLYLDKDGLWKDINNAEPVIDLSASVLYGAVRVVRWTPSRVPDDCIDDYVFIVFYSDGTVSVIYGTDEDAGLVGVNIMAKRIYLPDEYIKAKISNITTDAHGSPSIDTTTDDPDHPISRVYPEGWRVRMTAASAVGEDIFNRWVNKNGDVLSLDRDLIVYIDDEDDYIAEYSWTGFQDEFAQVRNDVAVLLGYRNLHGMDIYVQDTEPRVQDCVWIDTRGIDQILE